MAVIILAGHVTHRLAGASPVIVALTHSGLRLGTVDLVTPLLDALLVDVLEILLHTLVDVFHIE